MAMVIKEYMAQYDAIEIEIEQIRKEIKKTEDSIEKLIKEGTVQDKVKGGLGGMQGFKIEGFPEKEYNRRKQILRNKTSRLQEKENDLLEKKEEIEKFIDEIPISRDRIIFKMIFIENKKQQVVADFLHIDRSLVSKIISKYS